MIAQKVQSGLNPPKMYQNPGEDEFGSKEQPIIEVLEQRRRQLEREIADFKAEKEKEYRVFEKQLRGNSKEGSTQKKSKGENRQGRSKQEDAATVGNSRKKEQAYNRAGPNDTSPPQNDPIPQDTTAFGISKSSSGGSPGPPEQPVLLGHSRGHEREREFAGLFTPTYLPLLRGKTIDEEATSTDLSEPPFLESDDSFSRGTNKAILSSSAQDAHPPMVLSPPMPPTRPLSSSVPPEQSMHHRRDSSRSDASIASLRSSLRDSKQPRSPKRVLFSIDNTVVSPSTSPVARRSNKTTTVKPSASFNTSRSSEKFEVVRNQTSNSGCAANIPQGNGLGSSLSSATANGWAASLSPFRKLYEANETKKSLLSCGDDFEPLYHDDDLFTFDEDLDLVEKKKARESSGDNEVEIEDEEEEEEGKRMKDPLMTSSPHAGSLPIEIKWPGRREGRG